MTILPKLVFLATFFAVAVVHGLLCSFIVQVSEVKDLTAAQYGVSLAYGLLISVWLAAEAGFLVFRTQPRYASPSEDEEAASAEKLMEEKNASDTEKALPSPEPVVPEHARIFFVKSSHMAGLRVAAEFVLIMGYVYVCDRTTLIAKGPKQPTKAGFWLLNGLILLAGIATFRHNHGMTSSTPEAKPLQRDQTEEWKGWMQIMFVLYHYFNEAEIYNAIRIYIAAYVWMTGFGNFSYYYIKADFSIQRFAQMMWRLNFFVFFICVTMNNEYMLYYICAMHTFFTWLVYFALLAFNKYNRSNPVLFVKILCTFAVAVVLYDVPGVFHTVMGPFKFLLDFHDPLHPEFTDALHEWFFRSGLDHFVWVFGMFCAFSFPWLDKNLLAIEYLPSSQKIIAKLGLFGLALGVGVWWYFNYFSLPKREYNKVHPYTSFIPIFVYMVLRNLTPVMRRWHMHLFAWTGKITLETYILQFHIWMKTTGINGSPKNLMVLLPGWYWTNFVLISAVYVFVSYRVFHITNALKESVIPKDDWDILKRIVMIVITISLFYGSGVLLKSSF
mmetsp:Transcript_19737/g.41955  ORF Transcript_19737/g.41955 Transcript_19737/m.41955 type:complete len:556 (-) Transcript_19737:301-1968(-)